MTIDNRVDHPHLIHTQQQSTSVTTSTWKTHKDYLVFAQKKAIAIKEDAKGELLEPDNEVAKEAMEVVRE